MTNHAVLMKQTPRRLNRWTPLDHEKFDALFRETAAREWKDLSLSWLHLKAVAVAESGLNPLAKSPAGALGLMQLMPATGREMGLASQADFFDPAKSAAAGARFLARCWRLMPPSVPDEERFLFAAASYNAGPGNVLKARARAGAEGYPVTDFLGAAVMLPSYTFGHARETLHYVARVKRILADLRRWHGETGAPS